MIESTLGAITSPNLLKKIYQSTMAVNPACGMLFRYVLETGALQSQALQLTVKDMQSLLESDEHPFSSETVDLFKSFCGNRDPYDKFFSYENVALTKSAIRNIWKKVSNVCPPYVMTIMAVRKTYYWNMYLKATDKGPIKHQLQIFDDEELAKFFNVPISALSQNNRSSSKTSLMLSIQNVDDVINKTKELMEHIQDTYTDSLLPDSYYSTIINYIDMLDSANNKFKADLTQF